MSGQQEIERRDPVETYVQPVAQEAASLSFINEVNETMRANNRQPSDQRNSNRADGLALLAGGLFQVAAPLDAQAPNQERVAISNHIRNLNSDSASVREQATRELTRLGAAALPQIYATLDNHNRTTSLDVRHRCEQLLVGMRNEGFQNLLDGLSSTDSKVRNAAARLVGDISTRELLESAGRAGLNLTDQQRQNLRPIMIDRCGNNTDRLREYQGCGRREGDLRMDLAVDMLMNPPRVPKSAENLGLYLARNNPLAADEARRLLERGAQQAGCSSDALSALAHLQNEQGDREGWLRTAQRLFERIQQHGVYGREKPEDGHQGVNTNQATDVFGRQGYDMTNNFVISPELRERIETMRRQSNEAVIRHQLQPPRPRGPNH
jgi:hypothetical protein